MESCTRSLRNVEIIACMVAVILLTWHIGTLYQCARQPVNSRTWSTHHAYSVDVCELTSPRVGYPRFGVFYVVDHAVFSLYMCYIID